MEHRSIAGLRIQHLNGVALAEGRLARDATDGWRIVSDGPLSIVGDIRLWNRGSLEAVAGGASMSHLEDREVLLAAFRRRGAQMMRAVDGDFAFVIWDEVNRIVFAARDRFGVKPLFLATTPTGLRFATEPKQLIAYDAMTPQPSRAFAAQFLSRDYVLDNSTAFEDISRVMPAHMVVASEATVTEDRYWDLRDVRSGAYTTDTAAAEFREHLVGSVRRRVAASHQSVSQLSGGLDSPSIAASADILVAEGLDARGFTTVATVFPGSETDESAMIDKIVARQPFPHVDFANRIPTLDTFISDMKRIDSPLVNMLRDVTISAGKTALENDAGLVLTGQGGDDVLSDLWLLRDILHLKGWRAWQAGVTTISAESSAFAIGRAGVSLRQAIPEGIKRPVRAARKRRTGHKLSVVSPELVHELESLREECRPGYAVAGIDALAQGLPTGHSLRILESQEAQLSTYGVELTHPFLDRTLVEFVASLDPSARPISSRDKTLARAAFVDLLPVSVLEQRGKAFANAANREVLTQHAGNLAQRFPEVPGRCIEFIDSTRYETALQEAVLGRGTNETTRALWAAWTFMMWVGSYSNQE